MESVQLGVITYAAILIPQWRAMKQSKTEIVLKTTKGSVPALNRLRPKLEMLLTELQSQFKVSPPAVITFQPLVVSKGRRDKLTLGKAGCRAGCWYISINIPLCRIMQQEWSTLAHEVAHIGDALITGKWSHGPMWAKINKHLKSLH